MLGLTAVTWILFFVVGGIAAVGSAGDETAVMFEFPTTQLVWALGIALVAVVETVLSVLLLYPVWARSNWTLGRRLRHTMVVAIMVVLALMLNNLNVIGFKYF